MASACFRASADKSRGGHPPWSMGPALVRRRLLLTAVAYNLENHSSISFGKLQPARWPYPTQSR